MIEDQGDLGLDIAVPINKRPEIVHEEEMPDYIRNQRASVIPGAWDKRKEPPVVNDGIADEWPEWPVDPDEIQA